MAITIPAIPPPEIVEDEDAVSAGKPLEPAMMEGLVVEGKLGGGGEGVAVGIKLGTADGFGEGREVGRLVGLLVGLDVGCPVGFAVG